MILTNEDLLAISQVVDTRLDIRLKPMEKNINALNDKVDALDKKVNTLEEGFHVLNEKVESLESGLHSVRLFQENIILPRLNTIESCYLDTCFRNWPDLEIILTKLS